MRINTFLFLLVAVIVGGCAHNCPELTVYREGLHSLDETIYTEHKQLMSDAIAKGIRSPGDSSVLQVQIDQAEAHYQSSKKADAPTTQP